jgi:hypothetical protein
MYLRWKVRRRAYGKGLHYHWRSGTSRDVAVSHAAVLVESHRVESRPRQRVVRTLATLDAIWWDPTSAGTQLHAAHCDNYAREAAERRIQFWRRVRIRLGRLLVKQRITPEQAATFARQIAERVPLCTAADFALEDSYYARLWHTDEPTPEVGATISAAPFLAASAILP